MCHLYIYIHMNVDTCPDCRWTSDESHMSPYEMGEGRIQRGLTRVTTYMGGRYYQIDTK